MHLDDPSLRFLLASHDPSIRFIALTDLPDLPQNDPEVASAKKLLPGGPKIRVLMTGQKGAQRKSSKSLAAHEGGFGVHPTRNGPAPIGGLFLRSNWGFRPITPASGRLPIRS